MITIYGVATSRALRPLWLLEEIGLEYKHIPLDFRGDDLDTDEYRAINPNGRIPAMVDGDLILFESMAINLYIAEKYDNHLFPKDAANQARTNMWSYWVMTEVEHSLLTVLLHSRVIPEEKRDPTRVERNITSLEKPFTVLDQALGNSEYLLGNDFTVADLNVAAVMSWCRPARLKMDQWPNVKVWLEKCVKRPACKKAMRL